MGNHDAGRAMGRMAHELVARRKPDETALALLDKICNPYKGADAEFEAEDPNNPDHVHPDYDYYTDPHPKAALGMLMVEAFAPNGLANLARYYVEPSAGDAATNAAFDVWVEEIYEPFRERYSFY